MTRTEEAYLSAVEIAMTALDEAEECSKPEEAYLICKRALKEISPCRKKKYYRARGGKFSGLGTLENVEEDHVSAGDFIEISKVEFETRRNTPHQEWD